MPKFKYCTTLIVAVISLISSTWFYHFTLTISILLLLVSSGIAFFFGTWKIKRSTLLWSIPLSAFATLSTMGQRSYDGLFWIGLVATLFLAWILLVLTISFLSGITATSAPSPKSSKIVFWAIFLGLALIWGIYWLAYYPGIFQVDSLNQWSQVMGTHVWSNWHPVFVTLLLKFLTKLGGSPSTFLLVQLLFGAYAVAWSFKVLNQRGLPRAVVAVGALAYALYPVNGYYMVTVWKDVLYSIVLLLLFVMLSEIVRNQDWLLTSISHTLAFIFAMVGASLIRKNGYMVVLIVLLLLLIFYFGRRSLVVTVATLALIVGFNSYTKHKLNPVPSPISESMAIPYQQIAATVKYQGKISNSQKIYLNQIFPLQYWGTRYNPYRVDTLKFSSEFNSYLIDIKPKRFLTTWFQLLLQNKVIFIKSFMKQTAAIWQTNVPNDVHFYTHGIITTGPRDDAATLYQTFQKHPQTVTKQLKLDYQAYIKTCKRCNQPAPGWIHYKQSRLMESKALRDNSKWNWALSQLQSQFKWFDTELPQQGLTRGGPFIMLLLIAFVLCWYRLNWKQLILLFSVPILNVLTLIIAIPAPEYRYMYSLAFSIIPIMLIAFTFQSKLTKAKQMLPKKM
ncbi:MAG: DUF6020 family protein [Lactobacillus sp.]|uniref:DUF6020 family protein n=1 Tax=Lacticaseibacillus suilingensis TaxID=2799577 RepID=UPI0022E14DF1|nr:DUF6020 family protein [Lacticaseibacillus suilingensis]MCI1941889.1 DUF6020 family protein [Lactobacillus sp.]MCI1972818.1 DUF6020 family protein [Lactobacillus sp.]